MTAAFQEITGIACMVVLIVAAGRVLGRFRMWWICRKPLRVSPPHDATGLTQQEWTEFTALTSREHLDQTGERR